MRSFQIVTSRYRSPSRIKVSSADVNTRDRVLCMLFHFHIALLYHFYEILRFDVFCVVYDLLVVQAVIF